MEVFYSVQFKNRQKFRNLNGKYRIEVETDLRTYSEFDHEMTNKCNVKYYGIRARELGETM